VAISIFVGFVFSSIAFLLLLLTLFLNMTTQHRDLYNKMTDMDTVFVEFKELDFKNISDEQAMKQVTDYTMELREKNQIPDNKVVYSSGIIVTGVKLLLIFILSLIVANGLEILIFNKKINESMHQINQSTTLREQLNYLHDENDLNDIYGLNAKWLIDMTAVDSGELMIVDCHSILLCIDVLEMSLGNWKIFIDLLISVLFIIPFVLVKRSIYYAGGAFLKEAAITDIGNSLMFYFLTRRACERIKLKISEEFDYERLIRNKD
jgi:hypothetical protein